ncbi:MAG: YebC/PmpR family DNA-binding transcriptional regulator [Halothiobacillaceae bacterium]|jgi:YebC/PmpR family DNA-binding regulatory protein|nr:YebC/PmpR family DNA-binding transcriptional regulator [Halothiobacillaceae bacterium]MDY0049281.1 YebC/PmpR family DNA-binding transcriptional regulator [Halothiobacillaceae bacterium]
MAGHSKWANIKHRKDRQDKKRGKLWTKIIREITIAAREGKTADPSAHPRLRLAWDKALGANMPKDTMERAAKRGAGAMEGDNYEELRYEGYGPGGVAVLVECQTDNKVRTVSEVRHAFSKCGGNLGTDGSVAFLFSKIGSLLFEPGVSEDALMEAALEAGADDVLVEEDGSIEVITTPENFMAVKDSLSASGFVPVEAEVTMRASTSAPVEGETAEKMVKLIDMLEDLDDVQEVHHNAEIPEEALGGA